jgi:hypothetical protein
MANNATGNRGAILASLGNATWTRQETGTTNDLVGVITATNHLWQRFLVFTHFMTDPPLFSGDQAQCQLPSDILVI